MQNDIGVGIFGMLVGALVTGLFGWLVQRSKGESDRGIAVLAEWSKLNSALADRLSAVEKEFADYRTQISAQFEELRKKHSNEMEAMRNKHRAEMKSLRELNEGLQRMIAQNSSSTAALLGDLPAKPSGGGQ